MAVRRAFGVVLAVAFVSGATSPAPARSGVLAADPVPRGVKACGLVVGAPWAAGSRGGVTWSVEATRGESCGLARRWVPRLTRESRTRLAGPSGYVCVRSTTAVQTHGGTCTRGTHAFYWSVPPPRY